MGFTRNGARTFLNVIQKACQLSHLPGWEAGLRRILGDPQAVTLLGVWNPLCDVVDAMISLDDWYNKRDHNDETPAGGGEDGTSG